ncbi:hypothetical protein DL766_000155 [Monosporascus sp. MC13-8B]|uniref:Uncharacterized protein n=1 Tax=Monosporascus cannonballus TaxID=155416 RepID=A0ABY0HBL3_9PEZI|nr:hypothetical protein DL762_004578 [Monosporascus cannonballus]RYO92227.1 hypothetical protein DL763_004757 [Monosporascus cannonballus]RYP39946.1 hypothetical protein DL766_000155 [Monosporascus sp. MC13-8B]
MDHQDSADSAADFYDYPVLRISGCTPMFHIPRDIFISMINAIRMHPGALHLIEHQYDGFHRFQPCIYRETFFLGTSPYALVWTFDPFTMSTQVMCILRVPGSPDCGLDFVTDMLEKHREHAYTPVLLAYSICLGLNIFWEKHLHPGELSYVRDVERSTGCGPDSLGLRRHYDIDELTRWIRGLSPYWSTLKATPVCLESLPPGTHRRVEEDTRLLIAGIPPLKNRIHATREYLRYLEKRAERLSSTRDSSSMKTVAIMTMAFLPGTFFAALLAIPSFDWGPARERFWVYWALTIPTTVLVLIVWGLLINRHRIAERLSIGKESEQDSRSGSPTP